MIEKVFIIRKRKLFLHMENIRKIMVDDFMILKAFYCRFNAFRNFKNARANRSKICKEDEFSFPSKGYCASQSSYYYGYKLHAICSVSGIFQSFDISTASIHDIHFFARHKASNEKLHINRR